MKPFRVYSFYSLSYFSSSTIIFPSTHLIPFFSVFRLFFVIIFFLQVEPLIPATDVRRPYPITWYFQTFCVIILLDPYNSNLRTDGYAICLQSL
jgi:hypothetical protein